MTLLSIIVPVYNKEKYLSSCIESILCQTETDFELILVNDGSSDGSGEICDNFKQSDHRIIVIHQLNKGVHSARNAGLAIANSKYIGFVDSDDSLEPEMYELLLKNAIKYNADISMCGVKRIFPHKTQFYGGKGTVVIYNRDEGMSGLFDGRILMSNYDKIYKYETVKHIQFKPALFEDTYYNFEALKASSVSIYDDQVLYNYMIRDNSHSMASFNQKYMHTLLMTKLMVDVCKRELPGHLAEAEAFDFNTNMIMLNMILIESKANHKNDYNKILHNLENYARDYKVRTGIVRKYKYGYSMVRFSAALYSKFLNIYGLLTNSEHMSRKKKLTSLTK